MLPTILALMAFGAAIGGQTSAETQAGQGLIFVAPDGWQAKLMADIDPAKVEYGSLPSQFVEFGEWLVTDREGYWVRCHIKPRGQEIEITRGTVAVICLANGRVATTTAIVSPQPHLEVSLLSNLVASFIVREPNGQISNNVACLGMLPGRRDPIEGVVVVYFRFEERFSPDDVKAWRMEGYR